MVAGVVVDKVHLRLVEQISLGMKLKSKRSKSGEVTSVTGSTFRPTQLALLFI